MARLSRLIIVGAVAERIVVGAFALYTAAMLTWIGAVIWGAALEADVGERFVRLSGWPTKLALVGTGWTVLLLGSVGAAMGAHGRARVVALVTTTVLALGVTLLLPSWFRTLGYIGISTSEFLDATFPLLGGVLPGGQATVGLLTTSVAVGVLTLWALQSSVRHK